MSNYLIMADSGCDICPELLAEWGVKQIQMSFMFENAQFDDKNNIKGFYDCMRQGGIAKTAAINPDTFYNEFKSVLTDGLDILYLAFSSGLSTTCNSAKIAAEELAEEFPDRRIAIVDSLCASAGHGLLVYLVKQKRNEYNSVDQLAAYAESIKMNICHWFTVEDLVYLKRGGRVSPTVAFVGGVLGIKPVLHVDNEGHLISVSKVRGRAASIAALAKKYGELAQDTAGGTVFISHGDCKGDADTLAQMIKDNYGASVQVISDIGPVIGAHSGPGTLAMFFVGKER